MTTVNVNAQLKSAGGLAAAPGLHEGVTVTHHYKVECFEYEGGPLVWEQEFDNLVVTAGRNKYLDATLKTGLTTPTWYIGLKDTGTVVAADTMASHGGWTEDTTYSNATRPAWTPGAVAAGSVDNSGAVAVFNVNGSTTFYGAFLTDNNTKGGSTGLLLGGGDFTVAQPAINGNVLNVTITATMS